MLYAFNIRRPVIRFSRIPNVSHIVNYALLIIIAGSVASIILEIDKFMIGEYLEIEKVAYYGVAIYIAAVIGVPSRSMHQITNPITAALLNKKDKIGLEVLYKKSSINLFIISGLIFLLIILNIQQIYALIKPEFSTGLIVVLVVSIAKLSDNLIGNNNAILFNSDYYRAALGLGVVLAIMAVILNLFLIPLYGINGAAFATFISIFIYNALKWYYVYLKFKASPFTTNTLKTFFLILALAVIFYFWEFPFHPFLNIALKSTLIVAIYTGIVYWACLSEDICAVLDNWIQKLR